MVWTQAFTIIFHSFMIKNLKDFTLMNVLVFIIIIMIIIIPQLN